MATNQRSRLLLLAVLLGAATIAAYWGTLDGQFVFDDLLWIVKQKVVHSFENAWRGALSARRPLLVLTLAANYAIGDTDPFGYHVFNLAVHIVAGLILFEIVRRTLQLRRDDLAEPNGAGPKLVEPKLAEPNRATGLAFATALIWLLHPLQTQTICYVVQRCESMMAMFFLLALLLVLIGARASRGWPWYLAAYASFVLSLVSKEVAVTLPLVLLLFDRAFLTGRWRETFARRGLLYGSMLLLLAFGVTAILIRGDLTGAAKTAGFGIEDISSWEYLRTQPQVLLHYARLVVWPSPLCLDYQWPVETRPLWIYLPGVLIVGIVGAGVYLTAARPRAGFLVLAPLLVLAPTSSIMPIKDIAFEHRMYLPLAALVTAIVLAATHVIARFFTEPTVRRVFALTLLAVVSSALGMKTARRGDDYSNHLRIWKSVIAAAPKNERAHYNLGRTYDAMNRPADAREQYFRVLEIRPKHIKAQHNLGYGYWHDGQTEEAERCFRLALEIDSNFVPALASLAKLRVEQGRLDEAWTFCERALRVGPNNLHAHQISGKVLWKLGRETEAIAAARRAVELGPTLMLLKWELAWMLATCRDESLRDGGEALRIAEEAFALSSDEPNYRLLDTLGAAHAELGQFSQAVSRANEAARLAAHFADPDELEAIRGRIRLYRARRPFRAARDAM